MSDTASPPNAAATLPAVFDNLALFDLQKPFVEPLYHSFILLSMQDASCVAPH